MNQCDEDLFTLIRHLPLRCVTLCITKCSPVCHRVGVRLKLFNWAAEGIEFVSNNTKGQKWLRRPDTPHHGGFI